MKYFLAYLGSSVKTIIASHLQYKHSGTFANRNPQKSEKCDPIVVTLLKMQPHYSQSSHENGTPSSGTSQLASYKEVPLPPGTRDKIICCDCQATSLVKPAETLACDPSPPPGQGTRSFAATARLLHW